jgi:DNA-binding beta-propeller fold protein YncE
MRWRFRACAVLVASGLGCGHGSSSSSPAPPSDGGVAGRAKIVTIAGKNGESDFADGDAMTTARFAYPEGLVLDAAGANLYIADVNNHAIRRFELATMKVTTVAGVGTFRGSNDTSADGPARLNMPRSLVLDPTGTSIYFTDTGNHTIRQLDLATKNVTTLYGKVGEPGTTDGVGADARFGASGILTPWAGGLVIDTTTDPAKPTMYVSDSANQTIRAIDLTTRTVTTIAGRAGVPGSTDGIGTAATFNKPAGLAVDGKGKLYVAESNNVDLRQIDLKTMNVVTVAGKAPGDPTHFCEIISPVQPPECDAVDAPSGRDARFRFPFGVSPDQGGGFFVVDSHNDLIRHFDMATTAVTTVAGTQTTVLDDFPRESQDSTATQLGTFSHPTHAVFQAPNVLYVADRSANIIRRVELAR